MVQILIHALRFSHVVQNLIRACGFLQESWGSRFQAPDDEFGASEARSLHHDRPSVLPTYPRNDGRADLPRSCLIRPTLLVDNLRHDDRITTEKVCLRVELRLSSHQ